MIGPSIKIKGEVTGDEDLVVQGQVEGTISLKAHQVFVGESGRVSADIHAKTVKIDGEVNGDISGSENVVISKLGHVRGNIVAPRVTLEDGAVFKGSIDMDPGEISAKAAPVSTKEPANSPASSPAQHDKSLHLDLKSG
jgi:cytoskeletal protein CcmA (bactofilin family)